jgi:hypothetical protein
MLQATDVLTVHAMPPIADTGVQNLLTLCTTAECDAERSYIGTIIGGTKVMMDPSHRWHNAAYLSHTKVQTYLPYALGGGYILSLDVARVLVELQQTVRLVFTPIEDATMGMWLAGMHVTRINWQGNMVTGGWTCCFTRSQQKCAPRAFPCSCGPVCACLGVPCRHFQFCWASSHGDGPAFAGMYVQPALDIPL